MERSATRSDAESQESMDLSANPRAVLGAFASEWVLWLWTVVGIAGFVYAYQHPTLLGEGPFYEVLFGLIAIGACWFGLQSVTDASTLGR